MLIGINAPFQKRMGVNEAKPKANTRQGHLFSRFK